MAARGFARNDDMTPETNTLFTARPLLDEENRFTYVLRVETKYRDLRGHVVDQIAQLGRIDPDMQVLFYSQASQSPRLKDQWDTFSRNSYTPLVLVIFPHTVGNSNLNIVNRSETTGLIERFEEPLLQVPEGWQGKVDTSRPYQKRCFLGLNLANR